jgi:nucleotide-binding universal stress UspA family protein
MPGIVVGIDGSGHSRRALTWAVKEAAVHQVPVTVVTVHSPAVGYFGTVSYYSEDQLLTKRARDAAREEADAVIDQLGRPAPPQVNIQAVAGNPAQELLIAAKDADLLVVGSRGAGGLARLVMGSVSSQVAQHAQCPVVIVPAGDEPG